MFCVHFSYSLSMTCKLNGLWCIWSIHNSIPKQQTTDNVGRWATILHFVTKVLVLILKLVYYDIPLYTRNNRTIPLLRKIMWRVCSFFEIESLNWSDSFLPVCANVFIYQRIFVLKKSSQLAHVELENFCNLVKIIYRVKRLR